MENCVFCKLLAENRFMKVCETPSAVAFMDIAGDVDGHILAVPKKHVKNILDADEETVSQLMSMVKKISNHLVEHCGYDGVNLLNASGESAGQSVPHFHIHIIPRRKNDGVDAWPVFEGAKQETERMWEKLRME